MCLIFSVSRLVPQEAGADGKEENRTDEHTAEQSRSRPDESVDQLGRTDDDKLCCSRGSASMA